MHRNLKTTNYYYRCLRFSFLMPNWLFTSYTITLHDYFCSSWFQSFTVTDNLRSGVFVFCAQEKGKKNEDHRLFHSGMSTYRLSVKFKHGCVPVVFFFFWSVKLFCMKSIPSFHSEKMTTCSSYAMMFAFITLVDWYFVDITPGTDNPSKSNIYA